MSVLKYLVRNGVGIIISHRVTDIVLLCIRTMQQGTILKPKGRKVTLTICLVIRPVQKEQTEDLSVRKLWVRKAGYIISIYEVKNLSSPRLSVTERFKMKYYSGFKYT